MNPSYKYLEHTADVLFEAEAITLGDLFEQCALALEEAQVDLSKVEPKEKKEITGQHKNVDMLLFDFLDNLVFYKDSEQLIFSSFSINIEERGGIYYLKCVARGEKINPKKHSPKVDVKAITLHLFEVKKADGVWKARVLVDI